MSRLNDNTRFRQPVFHASPTLGPRRPRKRYIPRVWYLKDCMEDLCLLLKYPFVQHSTCITECRSMVTSFCHMLSRHAPDEPYPHPALLDVLCELGAISTLVRYQKFFSEVYKSSEAMKFFFL